MVISCFEKKTFLLKLRNKWSISDQLSSDGVQKYTQSLDTDDHSSNFCMPSLIGGKN